MTWLDLALLALLALTAFSGFRRGLVTGALSLAGLVAGAYLGARIIPGLLGLDDSPYLPLVTLGAAVVCAGVAQGLATWGGRSIRRAVLHPGPLKAIDDAGGAVLGIAMGVVLCWAIGAVLLYTPGQSELRRLAQESAILSRLSDGLPPERLIDAIASIDPFSVIAGPDAGVPPPDTGILLSPPVRSAQSSVVRILGYACGLSVEGSGWIADRELVVTNAHVVAGMLAPTVDRGEGPQWAATVVAFDASSDVAVLRVPGLSGPALRVADPERGEAAAIMGFPRGGPLSVEPARLGATVVVVGRDAYGDVGVRQVTTIRGEIQPGNSGGPVVDEQGRVRTMIFGGRRGGGHSGFGVPVSRIEDVVARVGTQAIETACAQ